MLNISSELIRSRRSVRTFDGRTLSAAQLSDLREFMADIPNPYGIPVEFRLLDAKAHGLSSPVLNRADLYAAAKIRRCLHFEEAYGYSFEQLVLYAWSLGIGTVWIAGTMNRPAFEKAMELAPEEIMPCITPLGFPAAKMSIKESMMRTGFKADQRKDSADLFFDRSFDAPLTAELTEGLRAALEAVRWAPSACNRQPWRVVLDGDRVHFYEKKTSKTFVGEAMGDLQRIDVGIAMCHFDLMYKASGGALELTVDDPGIETEADTEYVASYRLLQPEK